MLAGLHGNVLQALERVHIHGILVRNPSPWTDTQVRAAQHELRQGDLEVDECQG